MRCWRRGAGRGESGVGRGLRGLRGWGVERTRVEEREEMEVEMERPFADEELDGDDGGAVLRRVRRRLITGVRR